MIAGTYDRVLGGQVVESRELAGDDQLIASLAHSKGAWLLRHIVGADFDPVSQVLEGPVKTIETDRTVWTYTARAKTSGEVDAMRDAAAADVEAEKERRILGIMSDADQKAALALGFQLITTYGTDPAAWPSDQKAVYDADMVLWAQIMGLRANAATLTAAIPDDAAGIAAFDATAGWD